MTDRELLELAAKAAGIEYTISPHGNLMAHCHPNGGWMIIWNPLEDGGDALMLAAKLRLDIEHNNPLDNDLYVSASRCGLEMVRDPVHVHEGMEDESGRAFAICRAIVRAAAEIGKEMA